LFETGHATLATSVRTLTLTLPAQARSAGTEKLSLHVVAGAETVDRNLTLKIVRKRRS
jgi:hypothetical protein